MEEELVVMGYVSNVVSMRNSLIVILPKGNVTLHATSIYRNAQEDFACAICSWQSGKPHRRKQLT